MRHGSLFSGIGGFDLAAEWMGWENVFHCEINNYLRELLKEKWPNAESYNDIRTVDFKSWRGNVDIISGGDPCQPHSTAGLRKGKEDDRYLWPQMLRAIQESRPAWIVNENVSGSVSNGILDIKIDDLESEGYSCQAYSIPAESVGALHKRERIWLIASDPNSERWNKLNNPPQSRIREERLSRYIGVCFDSHWVTNRDEIKSNIIRMANGLPEGMDFTERNARIKALGNSIVPQVAYEIFKAIQQYENLNLNK